MDVGVLVMVHVGVIVHVLVGGGIQSSGIEFGSPDISTTPFLQNTGLQSNPPLPQIRPIGVGIIVLSSLVGPHPATRIKTKKRNEVFIESS